MSASVATNRPVIIIPGLLTVVPARTQTGDSGDDLSGRGKPGVVVMKPGGRRHHRAHQACITFSRTPRAEIEQLKLAARSARHFLVALRRQNV